VAIALIAAPFDLAVSFHRPLWRFALPTVLGGRKIDVGDV